jgi:VIT1/CCC1 family predicted Fe2+/Mn2+ transporter
MIDPFTAFAMAQGAVKGIKAAIQLGKDVNGLYKEFSTFFQSADEVHRASTKMRIDNIGKTDAQISDQALQIAMASKALRDSERELKDLLYWSGNAPVWDEMMAERLRMLKERNAAEKAIADKKQKDKEAMAEIIMNLLYFIGALMIVIPVLYGTFYVITNRGF